MSPALSAHRQRRQLGRLETLIDSVYALVIVLLVAGLPTPLDTDQLGISVWEFAKQHYQVMIGQVMALVLIVVYWIQHNSLFGVIDRTDNRHTVISLVQLILLLLYFFAAGTGEDFDHAVPILMLQSIALSLMGVASLWSLAYSRSERRLLAEDASDEEAAALRIELLSEPLMAALTIPAAFAGVDVWSLAWLAYPLVALAVRRVAATSR